ncbi:MAG: hypothetical protein H7062_12280 [Candidatus Saccharimonas sp.]|nr:hypothetical protein [Planctomycetaceae bacterium]
MRGLSSPRCLPHLALSVSVMVSLAGLACAAEPTPVEINSPLPYGPDPINYFAESTDDAVIRLQKRLDAGELSFANRRHSGHLLDLLQVLEVPVESQTLVFSKTSLNQPLIGPKNPRAVYFNDDVTIGWVPGAAAIEIALQDARKGTVFYTLPVHRDEDETAFLKFRRDTRCTACHVSTRTLNVPGHIVGSFLTAANGQPREGFSSINHATEIEKRWGGWYVSGRAPGLVHFGNLIGEEAAERHKSEPSFRGAVDDLATLVDLQKYPTSHSDAVALLVLNHQLHFDNLVNRVSFEHRLNRRSDAEEQLIRYALMEDEAPLAGPITGSTKFAEVYQSLGPRDSEGRSLRQLDLTTKLFKYSVSPLIASRSFQSLPAEVKARLNERLDAELAKRSDAAAREVVRQTMPGWPK